MPLHHVGCISTTQKKRILCLRHKPAQAAASVPDKDGTLCSLVQFIWQCFLLVDPALLSKSNLQGWGTQAGG